MTPSPGLTGIGRSTTASFTICWLPRFVVWWCMCVYLHMSKLSTKGSQIVSTDRSLHDGVRMEANHSRPIYYFDKLQQ